MASVSVETQGGVRTSTMFLACVTDHGSASHAYIASDDLLRGPFASRNLADAIHFLCVLHGRFPGVIDHAANRTVDPAARAWFATATDAFAIERNFLAKLAVAAGPLPSTPGASDNDAVVRSQRHAIEMLAQSERNGCAVGAALALSVDWAVVRRILNIAAIRFGIDVPDYALQDGDMHRLADDLVGGPGVRRALLFGAEQIALQHRGLWDLLESRAQARGIY